MESRLPTKVRLERRPSFSSGSEECEEKNCWGDDDPTWKNTERVESGRGRPFGGGLFEDREEMRRRPKKKKKKLFSRGRGRGRRGERGGRGGRGGRAYERRDPTWDNHDEYLRDVMEDEANRLGYSPRGDRRGSRRGRRPRRGSTAGGKRGYKANLIYIRY